MKDWSVECRQTVSGVAGSGALHGVAFRMRRWTVEEFLLVTGVVKSRTQVRHWS